MRKEINVIQDYADLFKQFGLRYFTFRISYELSKKLGLLKSKFPSSYLKSTYPKLETWKKMPHNFFVSAKEDIKIFDNEYSSQLQSEVRKILNGEVLYFFKDWKDLGFDKEWNIHPLTKHHYDLEHWSQLPMYSKEIGDIKYVWEKSKFSYLIYLIRNDLRHQEDHSEFVFNEISRWIDENPPNLGPQYICSQEISIRLLNWSFALFFYKNSKNLNDDLLEKIFLSIEIQIEHVYNNINFSRISVRNNHSVTETLTLYLISLFFPFFKDAKKYKENGKKWFEEEIEYQIFDDGSDSQYSFNYHRVKIQLFSWAISSAKVNNEVLSNKIIEKAKKSLYFLTSMMANTEKGLLPNFGANDGSIYFKLSDADYQDFYPQLNALAALLNIDIPLTRKNKASDEDKFWFTQKFHIKPDKKVSLAPFDNFTHYKNGGYVQIRDNNTFTLFKTPELSFRAGQMDLFHIDIWVNGENILLDKGSYSYNTDEETLMSFNGVAGHNTICMDGFEHMRKGPRFTWLYKPKHISTDLSETDSYYKVSSIMEVRYPTKNTLKRVIKKYKNRDVWEIEDEIIRYNKENQTLTQYWNIDLQNENHISFSAIDRDELPVKEYTEKAYKSIYYGQKEDIISKKFKSENGYIKTIITIKNP